MRLLPALAALLLFLVSNPWSVFGQQAVLDEITRLENRERYAVITGDTATLKRLWAKEYVVNNSEGYVVTVPQIMGFIRSGKIEYNPFDRLVEQITVSGDVAVAMGREVVTPKEQTQTTNAGKTVTRRYTDVWVRTAGQWYLAARQATNVLVQ